MLDKACWSARTHHASLIMIGLSGRFCLLPMTSAAGLTIAMLSAP